jgi:hypothetical protein
MRYTSFATAIALAMAGTASLAAPQTVPGRDLLELPLGTVAEAPVLATLTGDGLWNPATIYLRNGARLRISAASLEGPQDQGVSAQLLGAAYAVRPRTTVGLSVTRAAVSDLIRTESDPQSVGGEIPYNTIVGSATVARRASDYFTVAVAVRYRHGEMDGDRSGAVGFDGGVIADGLPWRDARLGASTFLWRPANDAAERTRYSAGGDIRVAGRDTLAEVRAGYAGAYTEQLSREHYAFLGGRFKVVEARAGAIRLAAYGNADWRFRVGIGVHHARYMVGVAREETGAGLRPTYAFTLTTTRP